MFERRRRPLLREIEAINLPLDDSAASPDIGSIPQVPINGRQC